MTLCPPSLWPRLALLLALPACSGSDLTPLEEFPQPRLHFAVPLSPDNIGFEVMLKFTLPPEADCPVLPASTRASLNGHALKVISHGGTESNLVLPWGCAVPTFAATTPVRQLGLDQEVSTFVVEDGHTRFVFEALHVLAERRLVLAQPQDGVLTPGAEVRFNLSVPTDVPGPLREQAGDLDSSTPDTVVVQFVPASGNPAEAWGLTWEQVLLEHGVLRFTVPASAPSSQGTLLVTLRLNLGARRCEGPTECQGLTWYTLELPASVRP